MGRGWGGYGDCLTQCHRSHPHFHHVIHGDNHQHHPVLVAKWDWNELMIWLGVRDGVERVVVVEVSEWLLW